MNNKTEEIRNYIKGILIKEKNLGKEYFDLVSGDIHREMNLKNLHPSVCNAMRSIDNVKYDIIKTTLKGNSSTITIRYYLSAKEDEVISEINKQKIHPSDSVEQKHAESIIANELSNLMGVKLERNVVLNLDESKVNIDIFCESHLILGEIYAHIGKLKVAQSYKIINDTFKMLYIEKKLGKPFRKMIVVCDDEVYKALKNSSWKAKAISEFGVEIIKVEIDTITKNKIMEAQKRQYR